MPLRSRGAPDPRSVATENRGASRSRRVVLIANTGWNIIRFRRELIMALLEGGFDVSVVAAFNDEECELLCRLGAQPFRLPLDAAGHNPVRDLVYAARLTRLLRRLKPDLVHLFTIKPVIYGALAARGAGVPAIVASITGAGVLGRGRTRWLRAVVRPWVRVALRAPALTIFQNRDDLQSFVAAGLVSAARAMCIRGSGVDTELLQPDWSVPAPRRTRFMMASRMLWSKGVADFVTAARLVKQRHAQASFVIFGGTSEDYGSKNPDFIGRAWLEALNREGVVTWRGWTDPAEIETAMRTSAAVVLPSSYPEGVPRSLIEAAAAGAPIITTDQPGCRDIVIDGSSGFLCPTHSPECLAEAMLQLLDCPDRITAMGQAGRRLAAESFDTRVVTRATLEVYDRVLTQPHRAVSSDDRTQRAESDQPDATRRLEIGSESEAPNHTPDLTDLQISAVDPDKDRRPHDVISMRFCAEPTTAVPGEALRQGAREAGRRT